MDLPLDQQIRGLPVDVARSTPDLNQGARTICTIAGACTCACCHSHHAPVDAEERLPPGQHRTGTAPDVATAAQSRHHEIAMDGGRASPAERPTATVLGPSASFVGGGLRWRRDGRQIG